MGETEAANSQGGGPGRRSLDTCTLFEAVVAILMIAGLWLLAAVLTEVINIYLVSLEPGMFLAIFVGLSILLIGVAIVTCWITEDRGTEKTVIPVRMPEVLERGFVRFRLWLKNSAKRQMAFAFCLALLASIGAHLFKVLVGSEFGLHDALNMVATGFGIILALILVSALIFGLLPERQHRG